MTNELKEILKILKKCEFGACITKHNSRVLLDYITNLQEENMKLISENEAIKNIKYTVDETIYKLRIDKAIPMLKDLNIKLKDILKIGIDIKEISDIESLLQGEDKELKENK